MYSNTARARANSLNCKIRNMARKKGARAGSFFILDCLRFGLGSGLFGEN
jgi:hypothetical protein